MSNLNLKTITFPELDNTYEIAVQPDSNCDNLTAGTALAVLSDSYTEDAVPYKFRRTPYKSRRLMDSIIGGTVAWNQLMRPFESTYYSQGGSDATYSYSDGDVVITVTGATSAGLISTQSAYRTTFPANHVLLTAFEAKQNRDLANAYSVSPDATTVNSTQRYQYDIFENAPINEWFFKAYIIKRNNDISNFGVRFSAISSSPLAQGDEVSIRNLMSFDLTAMFGSTIADYIYNLEQSTAGAGVSLFRSLFGASYYPFNAGELVSISGLSARKAVGFNAFNRSAASENKVPVYTTGALANEANSISSDYIHVLKDVPYYFSHNALVFGYDKDKTYLGCWHALNGWVKSAGTSVTTLSIAYGSEVEYIKLAFRTATNGNKDMTKENICVSLSASAAYEPYKEYVYPLDSTLTLRGIPKLGSNNKLYFDGDTYASDGTVTRRYGIVDLGTLTWSYNSTQNRFLSTGIQSTAKHPANNDTVANIICVRYSTRTANNTASPDYDKSIGIGASGAVAIKDTAYTDAATLKTAMSGVYLVYELATYTTEQADPYINPQYCNANGTEEYISETVVPVGHESRYYRDLDAVIPAAPTADGVYTLKCTVTGGVPTYSWVTA